MMGLPLFLYGLAPLANSSFESDADTDSPSSWDVTGTNELAQVSASEYQSAGDGIPSTKSVRLNVSDGTAGNIAIVRQRVQPTDLITISTEDDVELAVAASFKPANQIGYGNALVRARQYDATGTSTEGSGVLLSAPAERRFLSGGPEWYLDVFAFKAHADAVWVDVELVYDLDRTGDYNAAAYAYFDRVFFGGLADPGKRFRGGFELTTDHGQRLNRGDGVSEVVRLTGPSCRLDAQIRNLIEGSRAYREMLAMERWLNRGAGFLAVWADRDNLTNAGRHWQRVYHDDAFEVRYPPGPVRRDFRFRFVIPNEGAA